MDAQTRRHVRERAHDQCEYCQRMQSDSPLIPLQIEHIIPRKHGGTDDSDNLGLACAECNLKKSSNLAGLDPLSGDLTPLFHPRRDSWDEHFLWQGDEIRGSTPIGRTTIQVLDLNSLTRLKVRRATRMIADDFP